VLLAATVWWPLSARLALRLIDRGCVVSALCQRGHPLRHITGVAAIYTYQALGSRRSLRHAIERARPDFVIPCDDRVVLQLHEVHEEAPELRALIETSIGAPEWYRAIESRQRVAELATELGIAVPPSARVDNESNALAMLAEWGGKAVLKLDGSSGGEGVEIVDSESAAERAFRRLSTRPSLGMAVKRSVVNHDPLSFWSVRRGSAPSVTMQKFVAGRPANTMAACWKGDVLGAVCVEVMSSQGATGAALVVRVVDGADMIAATRKLVARMGLTGFCGLDFMLDEATGAAQFIELNPRCTQLGHLSIGAQGDLARLLVGKIAGQLDGPPPPPLESDVIAFFPQSVSARLPEDLLSTVHHDVPREHPELIRELLKPPWPDRQWIARMYHYFRKPKSVRPVSFGGAASGERAPRARDTNNR
jgi:ATP-grasp domain-containing protein